MQDNLTDPLTGNGGALHLTGVGKVTVVGGLVAGNTATSEGGGLHLSGAVMHR